MKLLQMSGNIQNSVVEEREDLDETVCLTNHGIYAWIPARYVLSFFGFWGFFIVYALRVNLSVAIVAMVVSKSEFTNKNTSLECPNLTDAYGSVFESSSKNHGEFDWDEKTKGLVLGAFFYGYVITQVPGGYFAEKFGGKWLLGGGVFITSLFTLLMPLAARWNFVALIITRIIAGLGEGVTFPALYALYAKWIPIQEQSFQVGLTGNGANVGTIITMPVAALLCGIEYDNGWPLVFYIFGTLGCIWFVFWCIFITSSPEEHGKITKRELQYIQLNRVTITDRNLLGPTPWFAMLTSIPVWALALTKFAGAWSYYTLLTELPNYLQAILNSNISTNGFQNALIYLSNSIMVLVSGYVADYLRVINYFSTSTIRKIFQTIALVGCSICLACITSVGCDRFTILLLLVAAMAIYGFAAGGEGSMALDIAPNHSGIVCGFTNGFCNFSGIFAPLVTGILTNHSETRESWGTVFYVSATVNLLGAIIFLIFGSAEPQPWSEGPQYSRVNTLDQTPLLEEDDFGT